ncbi:hypothetical protein H4219_005103 [Mycoemilia scoparia]|uniref:Uncharacterized protein n=1 Tax=Mycoemilia scoparia TaxID=417184 RepID=A0A9W7ZVW9_9FUNG|nr:hypothetical protein H4219_005103 [Mycoemilia scoparia]
MHLDMRSSHKEKQLRDISKAFWMINNMAEFTWSKYLDAMSMKHTLYVNNKMHSIKHITGWLVEDAKMTVNGWMSMTSFEKTMSDSIETNLCILQKKLLKSQHQSPRLLLINDRGHKASGKTKALPSLLTTAIMSSKPTFYETSKISELLIEIGIDNLSSQITERCQCFCDYLNTRKQLQFHMRSDQNKCPMVESIVDYLSIEKSPNSPKCICPKICSSRYDCIVLAKRRWNLQNVKKKGIDVAWFARPPTDGDMTRSGIVAGGSSELSLESTGCPQNLYSPHTPRFIGQYDQAASTVPLPDTIEIDLANPSVVGSHNGIPFTDKLQISPEYHIPANAGDSSKDGRAGGNSNPASPLSLNNDISSPFSLQNNELNSISVIISAIDNLLNEPPYSTNEDEEPFLDMSSVESVDGENKTNHSKFSRSKISLFKPSIATTPYYRHNLDSIPSKPCSANVTATTTITETDTKGKGKARRVSNRRKKAPNISSAARTFRDGSKTLSSASENVDDYDANGSETGLIRKLSIISSNINVIDNFLSEPAKCAKTSENL